MSTCRVPGMKLGAEASNDEYDRLLLPVLTKTAVQLGDLRTLLTSLNLILAPHLKMGIIKSILQGYWVFFARKERARAS